MLHRTWDKLTAQDQKSLQLLVRLAARRDALDRFWTPGMVNVPRDWGMPETAFRREWQSAYRRAQHLARLLASPER